MNACRLCLTTLLALALCTVCVLPRVLGQTTTATLSGTVEDENGAVIPSARVAAVDTAKGLKRETTTNEQGAFTIPLLPPSTYTVTVEQTGFTPVELSNVVLNVGDHKALVIQLKAGTVSEMVRVAAEPPLINESPTVGTVVNRQFVENIPINGRSFQSLMALTPGVVLTRSTFSEQGQFSVNGQRPDANYFILDGVSANFSSNGSAGGNQAPSGVLPALSALGSSSNLVSIESLQEFRVLTSTYAPEYGRSPGAQVSMVTRSGTNDFHGTLFEYFRNDIFEANDWFANASRLGKPPLRQNDFGGVIGGPILLPRFGEGGSQPWYDGRNKTFFFFSIEGLRVRLPRVRITDVPSLAARQSAQPSIRPFLNGFPLPNGATNSSTNFAQFAGSYSDPSSLNATSLRLDHTFNSRLTLFARYNYSPSESRSRAGSGTRSLNTIGTSENETETFTVGSTQMLQANLTNEIRANYSKNEARSFNSIDQFGGAVIPDDSLIFPSFASPQDSGFTFSLAGGTNSVWHKALNGDNRQTQLNIVDNLLLSTRSHTLKFGLDYRQLSPVIKPLTYSLTASFNTLSAAIAGRASSISIFTFGNARHPEIKNFSAYAQDTWQTTRRLTLTYGIRWEVNPAPSNPKETPALAVTNADTPEAIALAPVGSQLYQTTYGNFAPRVGMSYQISQKQGLEAVLRGGFGIFYDTGNASATLGFGSSAFPYNLSRFLPANTQFPVVDTALLAPPTFSLSPPLPEFFATDPGLKLPRTFQWNVSLEQSLGPNQTISATYVGAAGRRLLRTIRYTRPIISANFTSVSITKNLDTSDYHGLQLQFQRRLTRGLQALASYAWSHSIDTSSSDSTTNPPDVRLSADMDRGSSDFDVRHALSAGLTYNIPAPSAGTIGRTVLSGFAVDFIFAARSATPVNVTSSRNIGFGSFSFRPDVVPGVPLYLIESTAPGGRRFNPAAFNVTAPTASNRQGTLGRNVLRGFPMHQLDLAIRRQFTLFENVNLQLRTEFFNLFNHPNLADPIGTLTSASFGRSTSMLRNGLGSGGANGGLNPLYQIGGPRSIQFAVKLQF
jgi:hypothetical protein